MSATTPQASRERERGELTRLLGLLGVHEVTGEDELHGLGLANGASETLSAADAGDGAQLDLGLAEPSLVACTAKDVRTRADSSAHLPVWSCSPLREACVCLYRQG
jgi:hypothetical protein